MRPRFKHYNVIFPKKQLFQRVDDLFDLRRAESYGRYTTTRRKRLG